MENESDHGLAVLEQIYKEREAASGENPEVTLDLLHACYRISHQHRYEGQQDSSLRRELKQAVEAFVDSPQKTGEPR